MYIYIYRERERFEPRAAVPWGSSGPSAPCYDVLQHNNYTTYLRCIITCTCTIT